MSVPIPPQTFPDRKASLSVGVGLPRDAVKSPAPSVFRGRLDYHLSGMIWVYLILPWGRGRESRWPFEACFNFLILWANPAVLTPQTVMQLLLNFAVASYSEESWLMASVIYIAIQHWDNCGIGVFSKKQYPATCEVVWFISAVLYSQTSVWVTLLGLLIKVIMAVSPEG